MHSSNNEAPILDMHAIVQGDVQGVGFRATTLKFARQLGLGGHVKNLSNGSVEIHAHGKKEQLEKLLDLLKSKHGSGISNISTEFVLYKDAVTEFQIII
jgi:acylphosphatase